jgi:hypothetical protein
MSMKERRQHYRVDDKVYFEYKIIQSNEAFAENKVYQQLLGEDGARHIEATQFFHDIDKELEEVAQSLSSKYSELMPLFRLLHAKLDYLCRTQLSKKQTELKYVNISLGGMAFKTESKVQEDAHIAVILYTKPMMIPIFLEGRVVYSQLQQDEEYRTAIEFNGLTAEQEKLLAGHIMQLQISPHAD